MNKLTKIEINQYPEPTHDGPLIAAIIQKQGEIIDYIAELEARYESHYHKDYETIGDNGRRYPKHEIVEPEQSQ